MTITIHRGTDQIGGCVTEISTKSSRVFIDMGQNLPGNGEQTTPEQDKAMVEGLFRSNRKKHEVVVYTHGHEDHIGLFDYVPKDVPQMIGEGAKEILLEKYRLIHKGDLLCKAAFAGNEPEIFKEQMETNLRKWKKLKKFITWRRTAKPQSFNVGDIRITPFFNCHSIYDSYMFLIEADGKRVWHMGDYRKHGYLGKGLLKTLKVFAKDIDVLITEGTMLGQPDDCIHEREVAKKMSHVMQAFKYVFVLTSATDIERLASINYAARIARKPQYTCSGYMNSTMRIFTEREGKYGDGLFVFHPHYYNQCVLSKTMKQRGFVMTAGLSQYLTVEALSLLLPQDETLLIYSSWDGYYKDPAQVAINPKYKLFREMFQNVVDIHTSGHADRKTIKEVIETVNPKQALIGIHKDAGQSLESLGLSDELRRKIYNYSFFSFSKKIVHRTSSNRK